MDGNATFEGHLFSSPRATNDVCMGFHVLIMHNASRECKRLLHYKPHYAIRMSTPNERLRQARERAGYETATDAAEALGITRSTYIGHENGHRGFPASRAPQYARKFRVSEEWLLYGKGDAVQSEAPSLTLPVQLPNVEVLTLMFEGMLESVGIDPNEAARARTLARQFPAALQLAASQTSARPALRQKIRAIELPDDDADRSAPTR